MKGKLQSAAEYLKETEPAVRNLFKNLEQYYAILKKIKNPAFVSPYTSKEDYDVAFKKWQRKSRAAYKRAFERQRQYWGYRFSIGTLCGAILQIAHMGINLYSKNKVIPPELSSIIKPKSKVACFCIGRGVREVPIGLIIYAGRNQYAHWDEEHLENEVNKWVFNTLATKHGIKSPEKFKDPNFDLDNENILIYSSNLLSILGWDTYDSYIADMKGLLNL